METYTASPRRTRSAPFRRFAALIALVVLSVVLIHSNATQGSDFLAYVEWLKAFAAGDIFQISSNTLSPQLVPMTEHFPGTGYLFAIPRLLLRSNISLFKSAYLAGNVATAAFWVCAFSLLMDFSGDSMPLTLLGLAVMFVGTHAGHLSSAYASETMALSMLGVAMASLDLRSRTPERGLTAIRVLAFGCSAGLLIAIRPTLAVYAAAGALTLLVRALASPEPAARTSMRLFAAAVPIAAGAGWILVNNVWMTGSWRRAPYQFADVHYSSIIWAHPQFAAILVHPFHGLLLFHPLYAVLCAVLVLCWLRRDFDVEMPFYAIVSAGLIVTTWLQASWYGWWMGTNTFGGRAFSPCAILLMPLFVGYLATRSHTRARTIWIAAAAICVFWSFPILVRGAWSAGTYAEFLSDYGRMWYTAFIQQPENLVTVAAVCLVSLYLFSKRPQLERDRALLTTTAGIWSLAVIALFHDWHVMHPDGVAAFPRHAAAALMIVRVIKIAAVALVPLAIREAVTHTDELTRIAGRALSAVFALTVIVFAGAVLSFARLYAATIAARNNPRVRACYEYKADFFYPEIVLTSDEYEQIPGFETEKARLRRFVRDAGQTIDRVQPPSMSTPDCLARAGHLTATMP